MTTTWVERHRCHRTPFGAAGSPEVAEGAWGPQRTPCPSLPAPGAGVKSPPPRRIPDDDRESHPVPARRAAVAARQLRAKVRDRGSRPRRMGAGELPGGHHGHAELVEV